jgi:trehalose utilization protein
MGKIVIKNGVKWDYDPIWNRYTYIEKVVEEKPKKKTTKKGEDK